MPQIKKILFASALLAASSSAMAAPAGNIGALVPPLLTSVGNIVNPLLQPILGRVTGPLVGGLVRNATPPVFLLLDGLLTGPINALLVRPTNVNARALTGTAPVRALPPLPGLK